MSDYVHVKTFFPQQGSNVQGNCRKDRLLIDGISYAQLETELKWYAEKAEALNRYGREEPPNARAMTAVVTELSLDGGNRAEKALGEK